MVRAAFLTSAVLSAAADPWPSATAVSTVAPVGAQYGYGCTDHAFASSSKDFTQFSTRVVVPPAPAQAGDRVYFDVFVGVKTYTTDFSSGDRTLESTLAYGGNNGWTLQVCGYGTKDGDESGTACGKDLSVSSGHAVTLSVEHAGGAWVLSAKDDTTGQESLRRFTEYNTGSGYKTAFVETRRINGTYHASDFACEYLPASGGLQFGDISVDGKPGAQWSSTYECGGGCASKVVFGGDAGAGTSMQWSWDRNAHIVV